MTDSDSAFYMFDFHTHSVNKYTEHLNPNEEKGPSLRVLDAARSAGVTRFAITDHLYELVRFPHLNEDNLLNSNPNTLREYCAYLSELKRRYPDFFYSGIELYMDDEMPLPELDWDLLNQLDLLLFETRGDPGVAVEKLREHTDSRLILAHPPLEMWHNTYGLEPKSFVKFLENHGVVFELSRHHLKAILEGNAVYDAFLKMARGRIGFSVSTDYHLFPGNYSNFFSDIKKVVDKYSFGSEDFIK